MNVNEVIASTVFASPDELLSAVGRDLGTTPWVIVEEDAVERFVEAAGGIQERSGEIPPFMVLALTNLFLPQLLEVRGVSNGVNYGSGPVRFGEPVAAGTRLRASATITGAEEVPGGVQTTIRIVVEADGSRDPACTVESLSRWMR